MFAIVKVSGHQYRVAPGDTLVVSHMEGDVGQEVTLPAVLVASGSSVQLGKEAESVPVVAKIVGHDKGEKIHIRRFRAKSRHRRHIGFRQSLTTLSIAAIGDVRKNVEVAATPEKETTAKVTPTARPRAKSTKSKV